MRLIDADALDRIIQILNEKDWGITRGEYKLIDSVLFEFPTIKERKIGYWINDRGLYKCSCCNQLWTEWWAAAKPIERMNKEMSFCPMCGADMRGV